MHSIQEYLTALTNIFREYPSSQVIVAYSGGIDSSLVAKIAYDCLGTRALAVTANSPSLLPLELDLAISHAQEIGISHRVITTQELANPNYAQNSIDRCYFCKQELHTHLQIIGREFPHAVVMDGVNRDDLQDYRPGIRAAREKQVRSPLAEVGMGKLAVRALAQFLGLSWWNKPAQPCLSSRFPYGEVITQAKLERVAKAETFLRNLGWTGDLRVRSLGDRARIEVSQDRIPELLNLISLADLTAVFASYGFQSTEIDDRGFASGRMNQGLMLSSPPDHAMS
jgi:uncharacterized protein